MAEIKLFNEWLETHEISTSAIALWYVLMYSAFRNGWAPEFSVPVSVIVSRTRLCRSTIYKERNVLRDKGLIEFSEKFGRRSSTYRIIDFESRFVSATRTQSWTQNDEVSATRTQTDTQTGEVSATRTQTETQNDEVSTTRTQMETQTDEVSTTRTQPWTQNEKPPEVVSTTWTQNPSRVSSEADLTVEKNEKSPIYINNKDIDKGGCGGKKKNADSKSRSPKKKKADFDLSFIGDEAWEVLVSSWLEYKRSRNENYKSELSVKKFHTMLRNLSRGDPTTARRIIDKSIANNWAGIFELTENDARSRGQPATGQRIGQIKQPEDEERRRKLLEKFGGSGDTGKNKT